MQPAFTTTADWNLIAAITGNLFLFAELALVGGITFLLAHAVAPSLVLTHQLSPRIGVVRVGLYAFALVAAGIGVFALGQALVLAVALLNRIFPRWWI